MAYSESRPFPDAELVVMDLLEGITGTPCVTVTPDNLEEVVPVIQVNRTGGSDDGITDFPRVTVTVFDAKRTPAWDLAEACRQALYGSVRTKVAGATIDNVRTDTDPQQIPDSNPNVRKVTATYRLAMRRMF